MLALMKCVAEAVAAKGIRGLAECVPGGAYLHDVAADAVKRLRDKRNRDQVREDVRQAASATFEEAKQVAERVAREVAAAATAEDRVTLELYLTQMPGAVCKSLRRADDATGRTVPPGLVVDNPDDLLKMLPPQVPRFRAGMPLPGRRGWRLLEPLGAGGFGEVWKIGHNLMPDVRAVKFCTDPAARQRLLKHEGKLIERVMTECHGPNVVRLVDRELTGENPWLAYEYVPGGDLTGLILSWRRLPAEQRVTRATEALRVLAETTGRFQALAPPIVHRDLKPANVLTAADGALKITDFGIGGIAAQASLVASKAGATAYTRAASLLAGSYTPIYASPEQQRGNAPDPRDDVHALGVIGYQMLTGQVESGPGPRFDRDLRALGVGDDLVNLIGDCVDPNLPQRPATGSALAARLTPMPSVGVGWELVPPPSPPLPAEPSAPTPASPPVAAFLGLQRSAEDPFGSDHDVYVKVDGYHRAFILKSGQSINLRLTPGMHNIRISSWWALRHNYTITLAPGETSWFVIYQPWHGLWFNMHGSEYRPTNE